MEEEGLKNKNKPKKGKKSKIVKIVEQENDNPNFLNNPDKILKRNRPTSDYGSDRSLNRKIKSNKKVEKNNLDKNYSNIIDDSKQVKPDQDIHENEDNQLINISNDDNMEDMFEPEDGPDGEEDPEYNEVRQTQSDLGDDRRNIEDLEEVIGGFEELKDQVKNIKKSIKEDLIAKEKSKKPSKGAMEEEQLPKNKVKGKKKKNDKKGKKKVDNNKKDKGKKDKDKKG